MIIKSPNKALSDCLRIKMSLSVMPLSGKRVKFA